MVAHWTTSDEAALIDFLVEHKAEAGDGFTFKGPTWKAAAVHMVAYTAKGDTKSPKTDRVCKNKWTRLKETYQVVSLLKEQSGFKWNDLKGAMITVESESVWTAYVLKYPKASPFRNKGWPHYDDMMPLMPPTAKGLNVFHPGQVVPGNEPNDDEPNDDTSGPSGDPEANEEPEVKAGIDTSHVENRGQSPVEDVERIPWSPTPPRSRSPYPFAVNHKRQHSAISSGTTSVTSTVSKKRATGSVQPVTNGTSALQGLTTELSAFSDTFLEGIAMAAAPTSTLAPSPLRKTRAIVRAQELEDDLDDGKLAALIRIFQLDVNAADAYMVIKRPGLRKAWIEDTLVTLLAM